MQIGRLDIGFWKSFRPLNLKQWFEISYMKGYCGCHIFTISRICITWLGDECYNVSFDSEEKDI